MVSTTAGENLTETKTYAYDTLGNITYKSDVGSYAYDSARPHAVTFAGGNIYDYDSNGNMISGAGRTLTWSSFNKPISMAKDGKYVDFTYAPDRARYLKTGSDGTKTLYLDKLYELITKGQEVTHKQFIYAGSSLVAVHVSGLDHNGSAIPVQTRYMHKDSLGSVDTITDGTGTVVDRMSFAPFGSRRQGNWREATVGINLIPILTNRGFTGHEHIDEMDLIHMNGRVYDPTLGRFLSADPHIQSPYSSQSYNRYSYVSNNPLKYTDPSGYFLGGLFKAISKWVSSIAGAVKNVLRAIASVPLLSQIVGAYICGNPMCFAAFTAATSYAVTGDLGMALKAGVVSYVGAVVAGQVGDLLPFDSIPVANVIGNGAVGGVMSKVQGGKFSSGFIASAAAAGLKGMNFKWFPEKEAQKIHRVITAGIIGGTASVLGGGKFVNGAASAMFTQMYNAESSQYEEEQEDEIVTVSAGDFDNDLARDTLEKFYPTRKDIPSSNEITKLHKALAANLVNAATPAVMDHRSFVHDLVNVVATITGTKVPLRWSIWGWPVSSTPPPLPERIRSDFFINAGIRNSTARKYAFQLVEANGSIKK